MERENTDPLAVWASVPGLYHLARQGVLDGPALERALQVDPRSLIQGDYMRLRYDVARQVPSRALRREGLLVVEVDEKGVARDARLYEGQTPLAAGEHVLRYRQRGWALRIGPETFFFQEGHARYYSGAQYAELRVSPSGDALLIGLRGPNLETLGPPHGE